MSFCESDKIIFLFAVSCLAKVYSVWLQVSSESIAHSSTNKLMTINVLQSIENAHNGMVPGVIKIAEGELLDSNINRSPTAYLENPQSERDRQVHKLISTKKDPISDSEKWDHLHSLSSTCEASYTTKKVNGSGSDRPGILLDSKIALRFFSKEQEKSKQLSKLKPSTSWPSIPFPISQRNRILPPPL